MKKILVTLGTMGATAILIAGCGGGSSSGAGASDSGSANATGTEGGPGGAQFQKYTKCLSKHGVDLPSRGNRNGNSDLPAPPNGGSLPEGFTPPNGGSLPEGFTPPNGGQGGGGFPGLDQSDPKVKKALDACSSLQPSFPGGGSGGFNGAPPNGTGSSDGSTSSGQTN